MRVNKWQKEVIKIGERRYNTNLASEYYVLSMLYRVGVEAYLTLGNKKSVDILVKKGEEIITIDVKGLRGKTNFSVENCHMKSDGHFLVFVSFLDKIEDPEILPEVYVVPSVDLDKTFDELDGKGLVYVNPKGNRPDVQLSKLRKLGDRYRNRWDYFFLKETHNEANPDTM